MTEIAAKSGNASRTKASGSEGEDGRATLVDVLRRRAETEPERRAFTFLVNGEDEERILSHRELDAQARRIAAALAQGTSARRAILMFPPGLEFIAGLFGCFYAGVVGVPVYPPDPGDAAGGLRRVQRIAADADAAVVLTTDAVWAWIEPWAACVPELTRLEWYATDALPAGSEAGWRRPLLDPSSLAVLQYTSGSTGVPKGVMVTYANLSAHARCLQSALSLSASSVAVSWLPLYHDMGLIGTVLTPMQVGFHSVQMSPLAFLERPSRWLRAISRHGGTLSPAPNFAYDLCARKVSPEERGGLDLRAWTAAISGAEPVRSDTCERFATVFEPCGFRREALVPCYGLAEATLMVAGGPLGRRPASCFLDGAALDRHRIIDAAPDAPGARTIMGCGSILQGHEVVIVDPETRRECEADEVGEIWVAGPSVAEGYWGQTEETAATFGAQVGEDGRGSFLRTGDLGFVRAGVVFVTGRRKDLIVIRGRNHYPQDLERTAADAHIVLRPGGGVAFSIDDGTEERLAIVHEVRRVEGIDLDEVTAAIRAAIAREHQLHAQVVVLIRPRTLPKTSSGKVQRQACRAALAAGLLEVAGASGLERSSLGSAITSPESNGENDDQLAPSADAIGDWLVETIAALREVPRDRVDRDEALIALGVDSAEAAEVAARLHEWLGRPVPLRFFREYPTIEALARALSVTE